MNNKLISPTLLKNLLTAMKEQLLCLSKNKRGGRIIKDSPFRRLPSVQKYQVIVNEYNPLLEKLGIKLRLPKKAKITPIDDPTARSMNQYMKRTILRIRELVSKKEYSEAWKIAWLNIKFSKSFRASAFNYVCKGWYYNMSQSEVWKYNRLVNDILQSESANLDYRRVYIPKSNGKIRPLGVPTLEWRISLHLINGFFIEILRPRTLENQHAYMPNKGTMTAWRQVIKEVKYSKFIYETDLKGFFDNVSIWKILDILNDTKCKYSSWAYNLFQAIPKFPKDKKLDESKFDIPQNKSLGFYSKENRKLLPKIYNIDEFTKESLEIKIPTNLSNKKSIMNTSENLTTDYIKIPHLIMGKTILSNKKVDYNDIMDDKKPMFKSSGQKHLEYLNYGLVPGGVPQGMSMSPFLSILALKGYLNQQKSVNYADDQIFFSNTRFKINDEPENGVIQNDEKSRWVKIDNVWQQESLKFLGFRLFKDWRFESDTRNGIKEPIDTDILKVYTTESLNKIKAIQSLEDLDKYVDWLVEKCKKTNLKKVITNISNKNIFGFIMSCMQIGDWTNDHSVKDRNKAIRGYLKKLNKLSLVPRIPNNTDSSKSVPFLYNVIKRTMEIRKKKFVRKTRI